MENKIKELIKKWKTETNAAETKILAAIMGKFVKDLQSLLEFKHKNCCGKVEKLPNDKSLLIECEILKLALDKYGVNLQVTTAMEELAELISELNRYFFRENRNDGISPAEARFALASEIADVEIACKTLRILIGDDIVDDKIRVKILRLKGRLNNETTKDKT